MNDERDSIWNLVNELGQLPDPFEIHEIIENARRRAAQEAIQNVRAYQRWLQKLQQGEAVREPRPRIPSRQADLRKWRAAWDLIESEVRKGKSYEDISKWLRKMRPELNYSARTLSDITAAGEAGLLNE